jgi:lipoprotein-anchoring transpeptidase ErfK/SrfK
MNLVRSAVWVCRFSNSKSSTVLITLMILFWLAPVLAGTRSSTVLAEDEAITSADTELRGQSGSVDHPQSSEAIDRWSDRQTIAAADEEQNADADSSDSDADSDKDSDNESSHSADNEDSTVSAEDGTAHSEETSPAESDSPAQDEGSQSAKPHEKPTAPPPEQRDWISAWTAKLKQSGDRWIQVNLAEQKLTAWEGNTPVFSTEVSTGREGDWTPTGVYDIEEKFKTARMQGDGYDIPNVPYVMYFYGSYAIHGTFWHHNFGTPVSRGCINVEDDQAAWLFYWASEGTPVIVQSEEY